MISSGNGSNHLVEICNVSHILCEQDRKHRFGMDTVMVWGLECDFDQLDRCEHLRILLKQIWKYEVQKLPNIQAICETIWNN